MPKCQNQICSVLMEVLQIIKFVLKKKQLDFTKGWVTSMAQMVVNVGDNDILVRIVSNNINYNRLGLDINHVIGIIGDEEANKD